MSDRPIHDLTSVELRLDLAEAEAFRPATLRAITLKRNRIRDLTRELVERGSF
jgi:hypothetical protein